MRIIFLRKKLVEYEPYVLEHGLTLYHGTNLLNLYDILRSGRLGSEVGRHGGAYERLGEFYVTVDADTAWRYAEEASRDKTYLLPEDELLFLIDNKEEIADMDLRDQYVTFASLMFYLYGYDPYLPVVIELTVRNPDLIENIYFDENDVRDWLRRKEWWGGEEFARIIEIAKRDPDFSEWLREAEDPLEVTAREVEDKFFETFPDTEEVSDSDIYEAAFHLLAKQIYAALIRLAAQGDEEAKEILGQSKEQVQSFFFRDYVQISDVDEAVALIRLPSGTIQTIDLKNENALEVVEEIMKRQIAGWTRKLATVGTKI
jgi:hypothetical protein